MYNADLSHTEFMEAWLFPLPLHGCLVHVALGLVGKVVVRSRIDNYQGMAYLL